MFLALCTNCTWVDKYVKTCLNEYQCLSLDSPVCIPSSPSYCGCSKNDDCDRGLCIEGECKCNSDNDCLGFNGTSCIGGVCLTNCDASSSNAECTLTSLNNFNSSNSSNVVFNPVSPVCVLNLGVRDTVFCGCLLNSECNSTLGLICDISSGTCIQGEGPTYNYEYSNTTLNKYLVYGNATLKTTDVSVQLDFPDIFVEAGLYKAELFLSVLTGVDNNLLSPYISFSGHISSPLLAGSSNGGCTTYQNQAVVRLDKINLGCGFTFSTHRVLSDKKISLLLNRIKYLNNNNTEHDVNYELLISKVF
jgi:hypothetical protein